MHRSMLCHNILYKIINKEIKYTYLENNQVIISIYLKDAFYNVSDTETIIAICSEDREFTEYLEKASQRR